MDYMEPEPACNQPRIPVVGLGNQHSHQIYGPKFALPARCNGAMLAESLWE